MSSRISDAWPVLHNSAYIIKSLQESMMLYEAISPLEVAAHRSQILPKGCLPNTPTALYSVGVVLSSLQSEYRASCLLLNLSPYTMRGLSCCNVKEKENKLVGKSGDSTTPLYYLRVPSVCLSICLRRKLSIWQPAWPGGCGGGGSICFVIYLNLQKNP